MVYSIRLDDRIINWQRAYDVDERALPFTRALQNIMKNVKLEQVTCHIH